LAFKLLRTLWIFGRLLKKPMDFWQAFLEKAYEFLAGF
jgi:hypothetical protein